MPLTPGPGCGAQGGARPAASAALRPVPVRAERVKPRRSERAVPAAPLPAPEPPAAVLHAFYACAALPLPAGPGWVAVGPVRRA
jgi:hypothetical protein